MDNNLDNRLGDISLTVSSTPGEPSAANRAVPFQGAGALNLSAAGAEAAGVEAAGAEAAGVEAAGVETARAETADAAGAAAGAETADAAADTSAVGSRLQVAVIGAGPAGIYAANLLRSLAPGCLVDIYEQLPAPYGLVRYGVAPDHPRIKGVVNSLGEMLAAGVRLFCGVRFGSDLRLEDLQRHYNAIIFATGAIKDAELNLPGVQLEGSFGAADFVSWYDGHPDFPRSWPLDTPAVAVIGNGNVALDIARMLIKPAQDLKSTEVPDNVYRLLCSSQVRDVHVFGRRGPSQVKFTPLELRELGEVRDADIVLHEEDFVWDTRVAIDGNEKQIRVIRRVFDSWRQRNAAADLPPSSRRLHLHFFSRPVEIVGQDGRVVALRVERCEPDPETGELPQRGTLVEVPVQAVYRAIGYFGSPLEDIPFDARQGVIPNMAGRVLDSAGTPLPGIYTTGWIKRGPVGLIGHTKSDAKETVDCLLADLAAPAAVGLSSVSSGYGRLWDPPEPIGADPQAVLRLLHSRQVSVTNLDGWWQLDRYEQQLGAAEGRERKKVVSREEMSRISSETSAVNPCANVEPAAASNTRHLPQSAADSADIRNYTLD